MKKLLILTLTFIVLLTSSVFAAPKATLSNGNAYIPKNTELVFEIFKDLDSRYDHKGEFINVELRKDVVVDGVVVIPSGTMALAVLAKSQKSGLLGKRGVIRINIPALKTVVPNVSAPCKQVKLSEDMEPAQIIAGVAVTGGSLLFKGINPKREKGSLITSKIAQDVDLGMTPSRLKSRY